MKQELIDTLKDFDFVNDVQQVDNKILAAVEDPEENNPRLIKALVDAGGEIQFVGELRRRLEDVYLELMEAAEENNHGKD